MNIRRGPRVPPSEVIEDPNDDFGFAIASLVLGIVGFCMLVFPNFLGAGAWVVGIILGIKALRSRRKGLAIAGIVLSIIGIITFIVLLVLTDKAPL